MRRIKFRGRVPDDQGIDAGKIVSGSLLDYGEPQPPAWRSYRYLIHPADAPRIFLVKPESIAQLVGYDADGREVYEGDELVSVDGKDPNPYAARLDGFVTIKGEPYPRFAPDKFRLKGESQ